ncbi:hypothetical protein [Paraburkholderia phytofirmans]|uniref:Uncharacterized protein n=1 Tax=Paraburkholderia phytofirmans TaxID=261302 RepID=A0ABW9BH14_9BURK
MSIHTASQLLSERNNRKRPENPLVEMIEQRKLRSAGQVERSLPDLSSGTAFDAHSVALELAALVAGGHCTGCYCQKHKKESKRYADRNCGEFRHPHVQSTRLT